MNGNVINEKDEKLFTSKEGSLCKENMGEGSKDTSSSKSKEGNFNDRLVILAKQGDRIAEEILVANFKPLIYKELLRIHLKNYDYDDLEQIGYIAVLLAIKKYVPNPSKGNFTAYVAKCVRNRYLQLLRRYAKYNLEDSLDKPFEENGGTVLDTLKDKVCLEDDIILNEDMTHLYLAIEKLPEKYREVIVECVLKDMCMKDYAKAKKIAYRVLVQRKHRAVVMLRELMIEE